VFKLTPSGNLTTVYAFTGAADGGNPMVGVTQGNDGNFYGTTATGAANNQGTIFQLTPQGTLTTLHNFTAGADGSAVRAELILVPDGSFYGVSSHTFFNITTSGTMTLYNIASAGPNSLTQAADRSFYRTTYAGGNGEDGTVFRFQLATPATPAISNVISASAYGAFNYLGPGSSIEIYGTSLAPDARSWVSADFNGNKRAYLARLGVCDGGW
jgi:uncharacterized repeat protein (TIGR03803 family)